MSLKYIKFTFLLILFAVLLVPAGAQETEKKAPEPEKTMAAPAYVIPPDALQTWTLPEKPFGGSMAEDGVWKLYAGITVSDRTDGTQELVARGSFQLLSPGLAYSAEERIFKEIFILLIGERIFDGNGDYRYGRNVLSSGFLTETGLPVEGMIHGLPTDMFSGDIRHPINAIAAIPPEDLIINIDEGIVEGNFQTNLDIDPTKFPIGNYRFSIIPGVHIKDARYVTLNNGDPSKIELIGNSKGAYATIGMLPVGRPAPPRLPWVILPDAVPNGGLIARHDQDNFAVTLRDGINARAIIPPLDSDGAQIRYRLEPALPFLNDSSTSPIALDLSKGEVSVSIKTPDGHVIDLGSAPIQGWDDNYLSTGKDRFIFSFSSYGHHEIEIKGHIFDRNGIELFGGGIYDVYVAQPLEIRTVLKPGMPIRPKESLDLAMRIIPPVPAKISVTDLFNPRSIKNKIEKNEFKFMCDRWGVYTPPKSELKKRWTTTESIRYLRDGEYRLDIIAEYTNDRGILYMGCKTLAGIVNEKNALDIRGEEPETRRLDMEEFDVFTLPPGQNEMIAFRPDVRMIFDPDLKVVMTGNLRDQRILQGEKTFDLSSSEAGVSPRSTSANMPAHFYPDFLDRRMYSYCAASCPDGRTMMVVKDGTSMTDALGEIEKLPGTDEGDFYQVYGSMVFRDEPLDITHYGNIYTGAFVKKDIARATSLPVSGGVANLFNGTTPFLHSFSFFPGAVIEKGKSFTPRFYTFPPVSGYAKITLTYPNGEMAFVTCKVDERGFSSGYENELPELWQEGIYEVLYQFYPMATDPKSLPDTIGINDISYSFYVLKNNRENKFMWSTPDGSKVEFNKPLNLISVLPENAYTQGTVSYCLGFNGDNIEESTVDFEGNGFDLTINIPMLIEQIRNFDPKDPHDVLEIGCFVKGVDPKGKIRFMANRITIKNGRLEY
jgi:hypothetical protein